MNKGPAPLFCKLSQYNNTSSFAAFFCYSYITGILLLNPYSDNEFTNFPDKLNSIIDVVCGNLERNVHYLST